MKKAKTDKTISVSEVIRGSLGDDAINIYPTFPLVKMRRCPGCLENLADSFTTIFGIWPGRN